jgi:hypothetical protein
MYRKKPVVIEAKQITSFERLAAVSTWLDAFGCPHTINLGDGSLTIHTLEGDMLASEGDYIIQGVLGEFYPCKPNSFEATYEADPAVPEPR